MLFDNQAEVPVEYADAQLPHSQLPQAGQNLPVELVAVGLHGDGREVLQSGVPGLGQCRDRVSAVMSPSVWVRDRSRSASLRDRSAAVLVLAHRPMERVLPS